MSTTQSNKSELVAESMLNNSQLTTKKIGNNEYAYITTSKGGDKIYCNISRNSQWMKSYQIVIANAELGLGEPIPVKFNSTSIEELTKLCDCGIDMDGNTICNISRFLIENEKSIPTISVADELPLEGALEYLQEHGKTMEYSTDKYIIIPTDTFREFAEEIGMAQSKLKKALKRDGILKPDPSETYRYKLSIDMDKYIWTYRLDNGRMKAILKEMRALYA